jgi:hypothetical protein
MTAIDKLTEYERNLLMRFHLMPLIAKTVGHLNNDGHVDVSSEWDLYTDILVTLVTTARLEIYNERKQQVQRRTDKVQ